jgi:hypothetical protein
MSRIHLDADDLRPLVEEIVALALAQLRDQEQQITKLAIGEEEAARLLSLAPHQLRDERLRGNIAASVGPGRKILYSRTELLAYLARRPWRANHANGRGDRHADQTHAR